eukprot:UN06286
MLENFLILCKFKSSKNRLYNFEPTFKVRCPKIKIPITHLKNFSLWHLILDVKTEFLR